MRKLWYLLLPLLAIFCMPARASIDFQEISLAEAQRQAERDDKLFFLHFRANWCMPCQWMEQNTFRDAELGTFVQNKYVAVKVDIDRADNRALLERFEVTQLPTVLIFSTSGVLLKKIEEAIEAPALLRQLRKYDRPAHHRIATSTASEEEAMSSPKPRTQFSRPPLVPDVVEVMDYHGRPTTAPPALILNTPRPSADPYTPPGLPGWSAPAAAEPQFTPRQVRRYAIQLAASSTRQEATAEMERLQGSYPAPVSVHPHEVAGEIIYLIVVGSFTEPTAAQELLSYLRQRGIAGHIVTINGE